MRLRSESKGSSITRGMAAASSSLSNAASPAAAWSAVSVGSPCRTPEASSTASLHSAMARRSCGHGSPSGTGPSVQAGPAAVHIRATRIRFCVSVPVLSEQMVVTEPRDSTAGSRRTRAFLCAILPAPIASATVTTAGSASGMAATARLTAVRNMSTSGSPRRIPAAKTTAQMPSATRASSRPNCASRRCSGVCPSMPDWRRVAMRPSSVAMPVATTMPRARP